MSKSIRSYDKSERAAVIARRLAQREQGLGYWAAVDADNKRNKAQQAQENSK